MLVQAVYSCSECELPFNLLAILQYVQRLRDLCVKFSHKLLDLSNNSTWALLYEQIRRACKWLSVLDVMKAF